MKGAGAKREARMGLLFASPWLIGFTVFLLYPLVASVYFSFCDYSVLRSPVFIGFGNYQEMLGDEVFWRAFTNTFWYAAMALPLGMLTSLILAMLLNMKVRGMALWRTLFFLPSLVPQVSLACLWLWILNGEHGVLNHFLTPALDYLSSGLGGISDAINWALHTHIGHPHINAPDWLGSPTYSKPSLVIMAVWGGGNAMLIYLASLQDVPTALLEAADLDGANGWQRTRNVTLPMISPVILFNLIMGIIGSLQVFTVPYIMFLNGTPARSTTFYTTYLFDNAFRYQKMGYASAMGWIMFLMILILTFGAMKFSAKHVHYQGS